MPSSVIVPFGAPLPAQHAQRPLVTLPERSPVTLWRLLQWTYGSQRAHRLLAYPRDWLHYAIAVAEAGEPDSPRAGVHPDAAALHAAVLALGQDDAAMLVLTACAGTPPEPCRAPPRPHPLAVDRAAADGEQRWCWSVIGGQRVDYAVRVAERVSVPTRGGRSRSVAVDYCPVIWDPDPVWCDTVDAMHRRWRNAMHRLMRATAALPLRRYRVIGMGAW